MKNFGRLIELHRLLLSRKRPIPTADIQARLQCSRATVMRLLSDLRHLTCDPIPYDRDRNGFSYLAPDKHKTGLPSLWFNAAELSALLVIRHQLSQMQPGFLSEALAPLDRRLSQLLVYEGVSADEIARRVQLRLQSRRARAVAAHFPQCAEAVLRHRRLAIRYHSRSSDETTEREVSPYRLIAYRDNWYLDAWCHSREDFRRFAVDRVQAAQVLEAEVSPMADQDLESCFDAGFGIFSGPAKTTAVLRFSAERARWVADEVWHLRQRAGFLADGRYELHVPYGDPAELILEILKYGPDVEVVAPEKLKHAVLAKLRAALQQYPDDAAP